MVLTVIVSSFATSSKMLLPKSIVVTPLARFITGGEPVEETEFELVCKIPEYDLSANKVNKSELINRKIEEIRGMVISLL